MVLHSRSLPDPPLLGREFPLPLDRPFATSAARDAGIDHRQLNALVDSGHLRRVVRGVYAPAQLADSVRTRADALALVLPPSAVVSGRTAAWLHGIPILERGAHLAAPPLHVSDVRDTRMRRPGVAGNRRIIRGDEITEVYGIAVTSLARTACDLGRTLWRYDALAALDGAMAAGLGRNELPGYTERFKGYRGVRQLRELGFWADPLAESPGESALRLHWIDAGLPRATLQCPVSGPGWSAYRLDIGLELLRYGVEYDGQEHHTSPDDRAHDERRRAWITDHCGWTVDVFTKDDVYDPGSDIVQRIQDGVRRARRNFSRWAP